ncbi:hypothetical protein L914_21778 [Phytophthora nicotianae]|nr:hypothetical protein L914_21778 [Phytophthora nicotianae]
MAIRIPNPGYDMTQGTASLKPEDTVSAVTDLITKLNLESMGKSSTWSNGSL